MYKISYTQWIIILSGNSGRFSSKNFTFIMDKRRLIKNKSLQAVVKNN